MINDEIKNTTNDRKDRAVKALSVEMLDPRIKVCLRKNSFEFKPVQKYRSFMQF